MEVRPAIAPLLRRGVVGPSVAFASFGSVVLATRLDKAALESMAAKAMDDSKDKPRRKRFVDLIEKTQKLVEGK